jgi:hypothetical protein
MSVWWLQAANWHSYFSASTYSTLWDCILAMYVYAYNACTCRHDVWAYCMCGCMQNGATDCKAIRDAALEQAHVSTHYKQLTHIWFEHCTVVSFFTLHVCSDRLLLVCSDDSIVSGWSIQFRRLNYDSMPVVSHIRTETCWYYYYSLHVFTCTCAAFFACGRSNLLHRKLVLTL